MGSNAEFSTISRTAMVLCDIPQRQADLEALAIACQYDVIHGQFGDDVSTYPHFVDFVMIDLCSITEHLQQYLSRLARYLESHSSSALIWTDMDRLDSAYAALPSGQCHYLFDVSASEAIAILAGAYGHTKMDRLHDRSREVEFGALHKISDELAEFARTLARIAEQDAGRNLEFAEKPISFRPAPVGLYQPFPGTGEAQSAAPSALTVREIIKLRRLRDSYFAPSLFADPAWDILLDLMASQLEERSVSVSSLCIAAAVPPTTALRWITAMTESGMLVRHNDPDDARRVFIGLSSETETALRQYLSDIQGRSSPMV